MFAAEPPFLSQTEELRLAPLELHHVVVIRDLASHPEVAATSNLPHPYPENGAEIFVRSAQAAYCAGRRHTYGVLDHGIFCGVCMLSLHENGEIGQIGYWIGRPFWGRGLATGAVRILLEVAFALPRAELVRAHCLEANPASSRVLEKNGFRYLGRRPKFYPKWRKPQATLFYELRRDDWLDALAAS